jgi:alpha-ribazole phosphatase/probable phosphoglycerate mutase
MDYVRDSHRVFLVRHGETDWNKDFKYQGSTDVPLNKEGLKQAEKLAVRLSSVKPSRVMSSPLSRAYRTAEAIVGRSRANVEIEQREELRELSFGVWEGLSIPEVREKNRELFEKWEQAPFSNTPEGGDVFSDVFERSKLFARDIFESGISGHDTVVVAHGGILRAIVAALLRLDDIDLMWKMRFDNCSITIVDIWNGKPSLVIANDTHHLRLEDEEFIASLVFPC